MALVIADRVQETCSSPGLSGVTLLGAVTGFQTFSAGVGNSNTTFYTIADQGGSNWEVGIGTYSSSGNTLSRDTVLSSSNSNSKVNFSSGTQSVFVTQPSERAVFASTTYGTSGYILKSNGSGVAPSWQAAPTYLAVVQHDGVTVTDVSLGNGYLPVLNHDGVTTTNVVVS